VNQIEKYFELHNIMNDKKTIHIETLNFDIKPYQWYQWVVKRTPQFYNYTWGTFTRDSKAQYGKVWEHDYFNKLTRIKHLGDIEDIDLEETTPTISCHALEGINTPQTLKIEGYIKKKKVTMLIDSGSIHNFIN
jgi:hypothetical protein